jgi:mRNA degradation ribonuclease J1/J2
VVEDGQTVILADGALARGPEEVVSRRAVDGAGRILDWGDIRDRNRIGRGGLLVCSAALDPRGRLLGAPAVTFRGLPEDRPLAARVARVVEAAVAGAGAVGRDVLERTVKAAIRGELGGRSRVIPEVTVHLLEVSSETSGSADATSGAY